MKRFTLATALTLLAAPVLAQDDLAAAGEELFNRQCVTCHVVQNEAGEVLAGRNAKTGPNLFHAINSVIGSQPDFEYGDGVVAAHEAGIVLDQAAFAAYVQDPTKWLREVTGDSAARAKMSFKVRKPEDAEAIAAFLATFAAPAADTAATEAPAEEGAAEGEAASN